MAVLRVRVYNIGFGDAILISVPDRSNTGKETIRHILIDVGNASFGEGGKDAVFSRVVKNILGLLNGKPLDLYVLTHEHLDHAQGLFYASKKWGTSLTASYAWLTASAEENYYERHEKARRAFDDAEAMYYAIQRHLQAAPSENTPWMQTLMLNNSPHQTRNCVDYLRGLAKPERTAYVYRRLDLNGTHPFEEASFEIWAPEEDTSQYYGRFRPMALGAVGDDVGGPGVHGALPTPPTGVDAKAFHRLLELRRSGPGENLLAIDAARNNTSVVFCLYWRGWRLLFPGDAERRSWKTMDKHNQLKRVHFLKVSHHGSETGMPGPAQLEKILPAATPEDRPRRAVVCTWEGTYPGVPDRELLRQQLEPRCQSVEYVEEGKAPKRGYVDFRFEDRT